MLEMNNLNIKLKDGTELVSNMNLTLNEKEVLTIVGESSSGKSLTALSIMGILKSTVFDVSGEIIFENENLLSLTEKQLSKIRGNKIAMIYQHPMTALNPLFTIHRQLSEVYKIHTKLTKKEIDKNIYEILEKVRIPNIEQTLKKYPHEISGGQKQRIVIAMALALNPKIIIADEPTTALDVTIQKEIIELFREIKSTYNLSIILITHDIGVVAEIADNVITMYAGESVEKSTVSDFFNNPKHPYSKALLQASTLDTENGRLFSISGMVPSPKDRQSENNICRFFDRCSFADDLCRSKIEELPTKNGYVRCIKYNEVN